MIYEKLAEEGKFSLVIGLFLESETDIEEASRKLGISELLDGNRMMFSDRLSLEDGLGDLDLLEIVSISRPQGLNKMDLNLIDWVPMYLAGEDCEIVGIYCEGFCSYEIEVPVSKHSQSCTGKPSECFTGCEFNDEWWRLNQEMWDQFEVKLRHLGIPGAGFTGWLLEPPEMS